MADKLEKLQQDLINQIDEGIFSPLLKKLVSGKLKRTLRKLEKDPGLRNALKNVDRALDDFERELEIGASNLPSAEEVRGSRARYRKEMADFYKAAGLGHLVPKN